MKSKLERVSKYVCMLMLVMFGFAPGCSTVEGTGRKRMLLTSESQENSLGLSAYQEILASETISKDRAMTEVLRRVGRRIAAVADRPDYEWEFNLIESNQINAFCLPGGKIAVYTGILPIMANEAGMAAVIGHEVGHAIARHGGERMTKQVGVTVTQEALSYGLGDASPTTRKAALAAFGVGANVGYLLPYSRKHELEADRLGLTYMAQAGYDPQEATELWKRMKAASGDKPPEFLSTHPAEDRRIDELQTLMPDALDDYEDAPNKIGIGQRWTGSAEASPRDAGPQPRQPTSNIQRDTRIQRRSRSTTSRGRR